MSQKLIGVVGPCGSGKSTLVSKLIQLGYRARHIAQEHSYVPTMWQKITNPDTLVFLDASYKTTSQRRNLTWTLDEFNDQQARLLHAKEHANLYLRTDALTPEQVREAVIIYIDKFSA